MDRRRGGGVFVVSGGVAVLIREIGADGVAGVTGVAGVARQAWSWGTWAWARAPGGGWLPRATSATRRRNAAPAAALALSCSSRRLISARRAASSVAWRLVAARRAARLRSRVSVPFSVDTRFLIRWRRLVGRGTVTGTGTGRTGALGSMMAGAAYRSGPGEAGYDRRRAAAGGASTSGGGTFMPGTILATTRRIFVLQFERGRDSRAEPRRRAPGPGQPEHQRPALPRSPLPRGSEGRLHRRLDCALARSRRAPSRSASRNPGREHFPVSWRKRATSVDSGAKVLRRRESIREGAPGIPGRNRRPAG